MADPTRPTANRPSATTRSTARRAHRHRGALLAVLVAALGMVAAACGGGGGSIVGIQRQHPLDVSHATLPVVSADGSSTPFTFKAQPGKLLVAYFGYTHCPDVCPTTLSDIKTALGDIGSAAQKVDTVFVTVDPTRDTPDVVTKYITSFVPDGKAARTTDTAQLQSVEKAFEASSSVTVDDTGQETVTHSAWVYVIDSKGTVIDEWAFGTKPKDMANDLKILTKKA